MAANAKEYKDLTQATSIDSNAQVALAQPNETELQTTTVANLAEKVQEINTDGPLAELELATSIGKQQLAEALTEKGAASTPSDTLVQMADKLKGLQISNAISTLGSVLLDDPNIASATSSIPSPFAYIRLANDDLIVLAVDTLYYIDHTLEYSNISSMIAQAVSSAECPVTLGASGELRYSENTEYIAVPLSLSSVAFYHVNTTTKTIELIKTVTLPVQIYRYTTSVTALTIGITNDGAYYFYVDDNKKFTAYDISSESVVAQTATESSYAHYYGIVSATVVESETGGTIVLNSGGNGSSYQHQYNVPYTITAGKLTFGNIQRLTYHPRYCPSQFKGYAIGYSYENWYPTDTAYIKKYNITVYDVLTQASLGSIAIPCVARDISLSDNPGSFGPLNDIITKKNTDGTWSLYTPGRVIDLVFDPTAKTLTSMSTKYTTLVQCGSTYARNAPSYSDQIARAVLETPSGYVIGISGNYTVATKASDASWVPLTSSSTSLQYKAKVYKDQFSGVLYTINGYTTVYLAPAITSSAIAAGAYSMDTTTVALPEESQQEA